MRKVYLFRAKPCGKQTLGILMVENVNEIFSAKTLELDWKNNKSNVSSIPVGEYICKYTMSPSFKKKTYEVTNVPDRDGVRIHSANFAYQIRGCIVLGAAYKDINADNQLDIIHSGDTIKAFEALMKYEPFTLIVSNIE